MRKILLSLFFICLFTKAFTLDSISIIGGICTPIKKVETRYFITAPCVDINYSHTFNNKLLLGADVSFFYQKEDPARRLLNNYLIDFTTNIGLSLILKDFSIAPQLSIGYAKYYFHNSISNSTENLNLLCYGILIDFSYTYSENYKIIMRPELVFYDNKFLSPIKLLIGLGIIF